MPYRTEFPVLRRVTGTLKVYVSPEFRRRWFLRYRRARRLVKDLSMEDAWARAQEIWRRGVPLTEHGMFELLLKKLGVLPASHRVREGGGFGEDDCSP